VTCPRGFACGARDGGAYIEECGKGYLKGYISIADGQSSCSMEPNSFFWWCGALSVCVFAGVCRFLIQRIG
jgi:hypothetical protein